MKKNVSEIKWFLEFAKIDLKSLKSAEITAITEELLFYGTGIRYKLEVKRGTGNKRNTGQRIYSLYNPEGQRGVIVTPDLLKCQDKLTRKSAEIFSYIERKRAEINVNFERNKKGDPPIGHTMLYSNLDDKEFYGPVETVSSKSSNYYTMGLYATSDTFQVMDSFGLDITKNIIFQFIRCLEGIPINSFLKCPECDEWFVHVSRRKKSYCSSSCASRHLVRQARRKEKEANSQKYRDEKQKGKERARKSYEKKVWSENPNARIERRPRKHKNGG